MIITKKKLCAVLAILFVAASFVSYNSTPPEAEPPVSVVETSAQASVSPDPDPYLASLPETDCGWLAAQVYTDCGVKLYWSENGCSFKSTVFCGVPSDDAQCLRAMRIIAGFLEKLPEGMLDEMLEGVADEFNVYVCRNIRTTPDTGCTYSGFSDNIDGELFIAVNTDDMDFMLAGFTHELWHAIEHRISAKEAAAGRDYNAAWIEYQPEEVRAAYWDTGSQRIDSAWMNDSSYCAGTETDPENVWFSRDYSRSDPAEDRATVFENMTDEFSILPNYPHLMEKAELLCAAVRACYPSCKNAASLPWEVYK